VLTFAAMLAVVAVGTYAYSATPPAEYVRGGWDLGPDSLLVLDVEPRGDLAAAGLRSGDRLVEWGGRPVPPARADSLAGTPYPFAGVAGDTLRLRVERAGAVREATVVVGRQDALTARRFGLSDATISQWTRALGLLGFLTFAGTGLVLFARSRARGYHASLGVALVAVAGGGVASSLMQVSTGGALLVAVAFFALVLFVSALPAVTAALVRFPDGRYTPRWTRRVRLVAFAGIVGALVLSVVAVEAGHSRWAELGGNAIIVGVLALTALGLAQKYRRAGDRVVRQQMKWVLLPFGALVLVFAVGVAASELPPFDSAVSASGYLFDLAFNVVLALAFAAVPLGVLAGALGFRPWDADLWIARSAAVGLATLGLAAAFAGAAEALRVGLRASMGSGAEAVAAALAAVAALVVFNPVREWVTRWADADLHRARERLTERLPLLLAGRQVVATPEEVGRVAIAAVRDALETDRAAVIDLDPDGWEAVAVEGASREAAVAWAEATLDPARMPPCSEQVWEDPLFVLRVPLRSAEDELVGVLALGTHGRGRGYSTEERKALDAASRSLAEALRVAERRVEAEALLAGRLAALIDRVAGPAGDGAEVEAAP
jgi:hypothetical protein